MSKKGAISVTTFREMALHSLLVGRMRFASHEANLGFSGTHLVYHILLFFLSPSVRSPGMTDFFVDWVVKNLTT